MDSARARMHIPDVIAGAAMQATGPRDPIVRAIGRAFARRITRRALARDARSATNTEAQSPRMRAGLHVPIEVHMSDEGTRGWARIAGHLDALLELDDAARSESLARMRSTDPALADELAGLLRLGAQANDAHFLTGTATAAAVSPSSDGGRRLGAYVLEALLGEGGSGSVWRARRDDGRFEGTVAIKLLHTPLAGGAAASRFALEGAILARLVHPRIARLMDAGVADNGQPYLVLEFVDGERIDRHCDAVRADTTARIGLFAQVLDAVGYAHRHLVVHRDIKPANVLVDANGDVRLLDFGIAKLLDDGAAAAGDSPLTVDAGRWFTPAYAAPEQLRGDAVSTLTDVYALGLLLFELLVGVLPKRSDGERCESAAAAFARAAREDAEAHATRVAARGGDGAAIRRVLAAEVGDILARALAPDPAERYRSVDAFAEDLRRLQANEPVLARGASFGYRLAKFARRNRALVASAVLLLLAIGAGVLGTVTQARRAEANAATALRERDRARAELERAEATNEFVSFLLSEGGERPLTAAQLLGHAETMVDRQFRDDPRLRATLEANVASQYVSLEASDRAYAAIERAIAALRTVDDPALLGELQCQRGSILTQIGRFDEARAAIDSGVALLQRSDVATPDAMALCIGQRARVQIEVGDPEPALVDARRAVALVPHPRPGQRQQAIARRAILADAQARLGDYPGAIASYAQALASLRALGRERSSAATATLNNFGVVLLNAGQIARAADVIEQSRVLTRQLGGADAINPIADTNLAGAWVEMGRAREGAELLESALRFFAQARAERPMGFIAIKAAAAWCAAGEAARCARQLDAGEAVLHEILPPDHSAFATVALTRANLATLLDDARAEKEHLRDALARYDGAKEENPMAFEARAALARVLAREGDAAQARALVERAVTDARRYTRGLPTSEWLGSALLARAQVAENLGARARAVADAREAARQLAASVGGDAPATRNARALLARLQPSSANAAASPPAVSSRNR